MNNKFTDVSTDDVRASIEKLDISRSDLIYRRLFSFLDLTSLNSTDSDNSIGNLCDKVNNFVFSFPDLPTVAAICVFPRFVPLVKKLLKVEEINIASVAGSFPSSQTFLENKLDECKRVIDKGADEIDIVISVGEFLDGNYELVANEIKTIKDTVGCVHVKVILETGTLNTPEQIYKASMLAMNSGADFIKTSTGKAEVSATPEAAWVMCSAISDFHATNGRAVGFKPAGGISTVEDAIVYYSIVESLLGKEWLVPARFRIGASRLANDLLNIIEGRQIQYF